MDNLFNVGRKTVNFPGEGRVPNFFKVKDDVCCLR